MRVFIILLISIGFAVQGYSQRVKRKGTTAVQVVKLEQVAAYTLEQLEGRWQEVKRIPIDSTNPVNFTDTLQLNFNNGKVELRDAISMKMTLKGAASIEAPNSLSVAGDVYGIRSLAKERLLIDDGEFIRELQKKDQFYAETVGKIKVEQESFVQPQIIDLNKITGKWLVYSRKAAPGSVPDGSAVIKSLNILSVPADTLATGEIIYYVKDISEKIPCRLIVKDGNLQIISDKYTWNLFTYKADGNEFVFGKAGELLYFSRH